MRKGLLGTAALLAASHLRAAEPPQMPPPAPFTLPADAMPLPPVGEQPAPAQPSPTPATQPQAPTQPQAQPQTQTQAAATGQAQNGFRDEHCGPPERLWLAGGP